LLSGSSIYFMLLERPLKNPFQISIENAIIVEF
jgi:hypothetical protein